MSRLGNIVSTTVLGFLEVLKNVMAELDDLIVVGLKVVVGAKSCGNLVVGAGLLHPGPNDPSSQASPARINTIKQ